MGTWHNSLPWNSTLLQYVDYILVAARNETGCVSDSRALLKHWQQVDTGHWASLAKLQFRQESENYLGMSILSQERVKRIKDIVRPRNKTEMLSFLGSVNYCRNWIFEYAVHNAKLSKATFKDCPEV